MKKRANLSDVAKEAGVSAMTVSRVINNHPRIRQETITKVKTAIAKLNYNSMPSPHKRGRPSRAHKGIHTGQIAIVPLGFNEGLLQIPVISKTISGMQKALQEQNIQMLITPINTPQSIPDILDKRSIDGIVLIGSLTEGDIQDHLKEIPTVMTYRMSHEAIENPWYDEVVPDNKTIGRIAAQQLLAKEHKNIAFIDSSGGHPEFQTRAKSFQEVLEKANVNVTLLNSQCDLALSEAPDINRALTDELLDRLLELSPRPTAIFIPSDMITAVINRKQRERGINPGSFEIISCNNEKPFLEALYPRPNSIDIRAEEIGSQAVELLLWRLRNKDAERRVTIVAPTGI
ncbi:MAG: LacI family DNA-binding transcriptional regulator [Lentisphaeraceae bacterium]|nr:LacI family DNA-binding transcriptional regulator [Lentisphaeraceae bacterium]